MNNAGLVDSHLHLLDFGTEIDAGSVIEESVSAGVSHFVCNGTSPKDWQRVIDLSENDLHVIPCVGLHPWFVKDRPDGWMDLLVDLVSRTNCAIGEIGLDRLVEPYDKTTQEAAFLFQLDLAYRYNRPVMVHCVKAWGQLMDVLQSIPILPSGFLLHAYSGSVDMIKPLAKMGAYFSFSGTVLIDSYKKSRDALLAVPKDRLLIESDSPYMLPPERFRVKTVLSSDGKELNHPANLPAILEGIAEILGETPETLRRQLWENAARFLMNILK